MLKLLCDYSSLNCLVLIFTGPSGVNRVCTIYSPNVTTNGTMMTIPSGTQNVILYCICRRNNVAVGPTYWFINGTAVTTTISGIINPYTRDNVPSPLIILLFTATHAGTYGCGSLNPFSIPTTPSVTIDLAISGTYLYVTHISIFFILVDHTT